MQGRPFTGTLTTTARNRVSLVLAEASTSVQAVLPNKSIKRLGSSSSFARLKQTKPTRPALSSRHFAVYAQQSQRSQDRYSGYDYGPPPPRGPPPPNEPPRGPPETGGDGPSFSTAFLAAAFVLGIGTGVVFDTNVNFEPDNVASQEIIDRKSPTSEVCIANGASAMVFDERLFVSFNPFNVYVAQPEVKPGCVLRRSNWSVLESRKLVDREQESDCKRNVNTFAFVGDLDKEPEISCVYHSEEAENQFMRDPKSAALGDGMQPRRSRDFK